MMEARDIVNRGIVNLTNCDQEPIHIPGSIQPHGFLLAVTQDFIIDYCSGNTHDFFGTSYTQLLGKSVQEILGADQFASLLQYITTLSTSFVSPMKVLLADKKYNCIAHKNNGTLILEFEQLEDNGQELSDIYQQTKEFVSNMENAPTLHALCQTVADSTRAITGYDRVMVYKFDKDYNGHVYAEAKRDDIEPFLGLHYPHTDIPVQARELYVKNLLRLIADINYTPVPIYTTTDKADSTLDLSYSVLRSVSPIHVQYLQNMGVGGTLTISLIHEGKLWGMITCHHYSAKYVTHDVRISALLQGHFLTSQINVRQQAEEYEVAQKVNLALKKLITPTPELDRGYFEKIVKQPELLSITNSSGVVILIDDVIYKNGNVPDDEEVKKLVSWLSIASEGNDYSSAKLSEQYPTAKKLCDSMAGVIYHSIGAGQGNCVVWFRPETLTEVNWAGDPSKAIEKDVNGLSPRKSFELWKEVIKCQANPWLNPELNAAANFAHALQKQAHLLFLSEEETKQRLLSERLKDANAELENVNWISTHDLKEPLRKIQVFASKILDRDSEGASESLLNSVRRMNESANRMQMLITDILTYSRLKEMKEAFKPVDLNVLLQEILSELSEEIAEQNAQIKLDTLPSIYGVSFLLNQLLVNLIRNSLKFAKKDVAPVIEIKYQGETSIELAPNQLFHAISISDNGIGFSQEHAENIFKLFSRLHTQSEYGGSGVGLALSKKIMQNHKGYIQAKGEEGKGAAFILYFPVQ